MKLFLSWSGDLSHKVALVLRDWLPSVIQAVRPYVSSEDIDKGARWSTDIAAELDLSSYGIICVTQDNVAAPWINFEAGALSKSIDKANVTPFLFRMKRSEVQGPLLQFQSVIYESGDILKLIRSLNKRLSEVDRLTEERLQKAFEVWWPQLQGELDRMPDRPLSTKARSAEAKGENGEILEEILELVRSQQRLLNSPEILLPRAYIASLLPREGTVGAELSELRQELRRNLVHRGIHATADMEVISHEEEIASMLFGLEDKLIHMENGDIFDEQFSASIDQLEEMIKAVFTLYGPRLSRQMIRERESLADLRNRYKRVVEIFGPSMLKENM